MDKRTATINRILAAAILIAIGGALLFVFSRNSFSWLTKNERVASASNEIFAVNQGFANNISEFATGSTEEFEAAVSQIFSSSSSLGLAWAPKEGVSP